MPAIVRAAVSGFVLAVTTQSWSNEIGDADARTEIAQPVRDCLLEKLRPEFVKEVAEGVHERLSPTK